MIAASGAKGDEDDGMGGGIGPEVGNTRSAQRFGKRRRAESEPVADPSKPPVKRSKTVSLVLLAGAGVAAIGLGKLDSTQREEDVLVYADADACIAARLRSDADCRSDFAKARAAYPNRSPRYPTLAACEGHHGAGHCVAGETVAESLRGQFVPRMAAFFLGKDAEQAVEPEAVYEHQPEGGTSRGAGGYCRSSGGHVLASSGGRASVARLSSASLGRTAFGGFGGTGRSFSSSSSRGFFGGG